MISMDKQYKGDRGEDIRIYNTNAGGWFCVHGAVLVGEVWEPMRWTIDGEPDFMMNFSTELIEVKPRIQREYWVNVYFNCIGNGYETKKMADGATFGKDRIACVKITIDCAEGDGL